MFFSLLRQVLKINPNQDIHNFYTTFVKTLRYASICLKFSFFIAFLFTFFAISETLINFVGQ